MNGGLIGHPVDPINFILTTNRDLLSAGGACTAPTMTLERCRPVHTSDQTVRHEGRRPYILANAYDGAGLHKGANAYDGAGPHKVANAYDGAGLHLLSDAHNGGALLADAHDHFVWSG
jgi:hypothetical protein